MPSRFTTLAILAFWLGTMGWFCYKEVWPRLRPGDRPPFTIDLSEEVTGHTPRRWDVHRNGRRVGWASTWVKYYSKDDTYAVETKYGFHAQQDRGLEQDAKAPENEKMEFSFLGGLLRVEGNEFDSIQWVTRDGDLRELRGRISLTALGPPGMVGPGGQTDIEVGVSGRVENGYLQPHWRLVKPWKLQRDTEPVPVATNHSVLNPLQPWSRLHNIRPGQTWRVRLFDPLAESVTASVSAVLPAAGLPRVEYLDAVVREIPETYTWDNQTMPCLIIEYRGDNLHARTWVRQSDGLVIRQEAIRDEGLPQEEYLSLERKPG
jgi:hypothetical protein